MENIEEKIYKEKGKVEKDKCFCDMSSRCLFKRSFIGTLDLLSFIVHFLFLFSIFLYVMEIV